MVIAFLLLHCISGPLQSLVLSAPMGPLFTSMHQNCPAKTFCFFTQSYQTNLSNVSKLHNTTQPIALQFMQLSLTMQHNTSILHILEGPHVPRRPCLILLSPSLLISFKQAEFRTLGTTAKIIELHQDHFQVPVIVTTANK